MPVPGHGLLEREQLEAPLLDPLTLGVDLGVAGDDVLRHLASPSSRAWDARRTALWTWWVIVTSSSMIPSS